MNLQCSDLRQAHVSTSIRSLLIISINHYNLPPWVGQNVSVDRPCWHNTLLFSIVRCGLFLLGHYLMETTQLAVWNTSIL